MTGCAEKVAYASQFLATNAAILHTFVHPGCTDVEPYQCRSCSTADAEVWHTVHQHIEAGRKCKTEAPVRPFIPRKPPAGRANTRKPRGVA